MNPHVKYEEYLTPYQEYATYKSPVNFIVKNLKDLGKTKEERAKKIYYYYSGQAQRDGATKNRTYLDYITRDDAVYKIDLKRDELVELDKLKKTNRKEYLKRVEELKNIKNQTSGLWSEKGLVDEKRLEEIKNNLLNLRGEEQFVWDTVISFETAFVEKHKLYSPELIQEVLKTRLYLLFHSKGMPFHSMEYFFSYHKNTDNAHVHLLLFEKEPTLSGGRFQWRYNFDPEVLEDFKFRVGVDLILKSQYIDFTKECERRENIVDYFKEEMQKPLVWSKTTWNDVKEVYTDLSNDYEKIVNEINKYNYEKNRDKFKKVNALKYNLLSKTQKTKINKIANHILKNDPNISDEFKAYVTSLQAYEDAVNEMNGNNESKFKHETLYGRDGLYARIGNKILYAIKRNIDVSRRGIVPAAYYPKIKKIKISIVGDLLNKVSSLIRSVNKFANFEVEKTKAIFSERNQVRG